MLRGLLWGIVFGLLVGGSALVVASVAAPQPPGNAPPAAPDVSSPLVTSPELEADGPGSAPLGQGEAPASVTPGAPEAAAPEQAPESGETLEAPQTGSEPGAGFAPEVEDEATAPVEGQAAPPARSGAAALQPAAPADEAVTAETVAPGSAARMPDADVADAAPGAPVAPTSEDPGVLPGGEGAAPELGGLSQPEAPGEEAEPAVAGASAPVEDAGDAPAGLGAPEVDSAPDFAALDASGPELGEPMQPEAPGSEAPPEVASASAEALAAPQTPASDAPASPEIPAAEIAPEAPLGLADAAAPTLDEPVQPVAPGGEAEPQLARQTAPVGEAGEAPAAPGLPEAEAGALEIAEAEEPVLPNPQSPLPALPEQEADLAVATSPAALPDAVIVEDGAAAEEDGPQVIARGGTSGLPGESSGPPVRRLGSDEAVAAEGEAPAPAPVPAIEAYGAEFTPAGLPLLSILIYDDGSLPPETLDETGVPATILLDPSREGAEAAMEAWRAAGYEVAAIARLPEGATPQDTEVALEAVFRTLPEAVALVDAGGIATREPVAEQTMARLADEGRGFVTMDEGLGTGLRLAEAEGVPAGVVYRDLDGEGQDARVIRRFLDQAAFQARRYPGVVLLARLRPATISALTLWETANRAGQVQFAPLSVLLTQ
ncbi:divergent polysaccharide deacetylase family protein [Pseudoroseicyclus sp. H15]